MQGFGLGPWGRPVAVLHSIMLRVLPVGPRDPSLQFVFLFCWGGGGGGLVFFGLSLEGL